MVTAQRDRGQASEQAGACPQCGASFDTLDRFCPSCGYYMQWDAASEDHKPAPSPTSALTEPLPKEAPPAASALAESPPAEQPAEVQATAEPAVTDDPDSAPDERENQRDAPTSGRFCPSCGVQNPAHRTLCTRCGAELEPEIQWPAPSGRRIRSLLWGARRRTR